MKIPSFLARKFSIFDTYRRVWTYQVPLTIEKLEYCIINTFAAIFSSTLSLMMT